MDPTSLLDAIQADVVIGTEGHEALEILADSVGRPPEELLRTLLLEAPSDRLWLPARAARHVDTPELRGLLAELARDDAPMKARAAALDSLLHLDEERGLELALTLLGGTDEPLEIRQAACEILGERGGRAAIAGLVSMLEHPSAAARRLAAVALGRIDEPGTEATEALLEVAEHDPDADVRAAAARATSRSTPEPARRPVPAAEPERAGAPEVPGGPEAPEEPE